jgi:hypothetical protein
MKTKIETKKIKIVSQEIAVQTLTLATSAFGLVAALAWNEAIKEYVAEYIKPYFAKGSGVISLFIYAVFITIVTVIITLQLAKVEKKKKTEQINQD